MAIKTDAPSSVVWDVLRCHVKDTPLAKPPKANSPAAVILAKEPASEMQFAEVQGSVSGKRATGEAGFVAPPTSHWGPKARAQGKKRPLPDDDDADGNQ